MKCAEMRERFSPYLDGELPGDQLQELRQHLAGCEACSTHFASLRQAQQMVAMLAPVQAPADLSLRLRVALSRQAAQDRQPVWEAFLARMEHALQVFMVPATAGVLSAIICFGLLIGFFAIPQPLEASSNDVPTMLYTPPELRFSPFEITMGQSDEGLVVEADVDANGRVQDYRIISATNDTAALLPQLKNMLIFTVFRPATTFGQPTAGRAVLSFSKINVKG
jgi:hypothetical protein